MGLSSFSLEKLVIKSYSDPERSNLLAYEFECMFNPASYSLRYENIYDNSQGGNTTGKSALYKFTKPSELSVKLILDGTGVRDYGIVKAGKELFLEDDDVTFLIDDFLDLTCHMDGELHEPRYLKLVWGDLTFNCRLASVNINYTLFNRKGQPIRAELDTLFVNEVGEAERIKRENKKSPDLTHIREVKHGDSLTLMSKNIYKSPDHYIHVARANNLNSLRDISVGQQIYFPPIEK